MKEKFKCKICETRFNDTKNIPRLLPCNNTICENCVTKNLELKKSSKVASATSEIYFTFDCSFCSKTHEITFTTKEKTESNLPLDETLLHQMRRNSIDSKRHSNDNDNNQFLTQTNGHRKMSLVLDDVKVNTNELSTNIKVSKEKLLMNFSQIEAEINARTDKIIADLNGSRERLIKELNENKNNAMSRLEEAFDTYASIKSFQQEYQKMCSKFNEKNKLSDADLDKKDLRNIALLAEDLNQKIEKTNYVIKQMTEKPFFKFIKPATAVDTDKIIGKLQFDDDSQLFNKISPMKSDNDRKTALKNSMISYRISNNAINVSVNVINDQMLLKITELTESSNEYNHLISLQTLSSTTGSVLYRHTESIGMQRIKKAFTNQKYLAILLVNQYLGSSNTLQLYEITTEINLIQSINLEYRPVDVYLNQHAVYVTSNKNHGFIHKYNFELKHLKSFGQSSKEKESFYIPKYFKLECVIQSDADQQKIYFVDYENLKIRIMNESNGKYVKKININVNEQSLGGNGSGAGAFGKNILIQIDALSQRIFILNKKMFRMSTLNWDGMLISQKEIDANVQVIDKFVLIGENFFSVVDYENQLVHFF